jgi:phosphatidate cytidylyltransferase
MKGGGVVMAASGTGSARQRHKKRSGEDLRNLLDGTKANGENRQENETTKKYRSMRIRTLSSIWMIGGFVLVVYMGHIYIWAMIIVIQLFMVKELFTLARASQRERQLPGFPLLNWYVFLMSGTWLCTGYICSIVNVTGLFLNGQQLFPFS